MARIYITTHALTTGVIAADVGGLARLSRYYAGKRWPAEDYHARPEGAFRRVRRMIADQRATDGLWIRRGVRSVMADRLAAIEAGLDRGELPMAKAEETRDA